MLSPDQVDFYREQGYVIASGVFAEAELDELERAFDDLIVRRLAQQAQLDVTWSGDWNKHPGSVIIHTDDVQVYDAAWTRALVHPRFTELLSDLIGPNVQLHHTKLFQKPPERGSGFPVHQDYPYFPHEKHTVMAAVIHLTDATEEMGCIKVGAGSHKLGPLSTVQSPGQDDESLYVDQDLWPLDSLTPLVAKRGDVACFNYLTLHASDINRSRSVRKTVLVQVRDPTDMPIVDTHRSHAQGMMLRGIDPLERNAPSNNSQKEQDKEIALPRS